MAHKRKGHLTTVTDWARHLRKYMKHQFWRGERIAGQEYIRKELVDMHDEIVVPVVIKNKKNASMKKLQYKITIQAPLNKVYDLMLGLSNKSTYEQWTYMFNPTSTYEGSWDKGSKILFIGIDEKGEKGGMVSRIVEHIPQQMVSIQHYGLVKGGTEINEGPEVEQWANGYENYSYAEKGGVTTVTVDLDTTDDFVDYMNEAYPKALAKLKEICEPSF